MATDRREARARPRGGGRAYPQTQVGENLCKFRRTSSPSVRPRMHLCAAKETRGDRDSDLTRVSPGWGECWAAPHVCEGRSRLPRCRGRDRPAGCTDCLVHRAACCAALACMSLSRFRVSLAFLVKSSESKLRPELWRIFEKSIDVVRSRRRVPASRACGGGCACCVAAQKASIGMGASPHAALAIPHATAQGDNRIIVAEQVKRYGLSGSGYIHRPEAAMQLASVCNRYVW